MIARYRIVHHKEENENGCTISVFDELSGNNNWQLQDPDTANDSEIDWEEIIDENTEDFEYYKNQYNL